MKRFLLVSAVLGFGFAASAQAQSYGGASSSSLLGYRSSSAHYHRSSAANAQANDRRPCSALSAREKARRNAVAKRTVCRLR